MTLVIATRNRRRELLRTLLKLRSQAEHPPIVVVDNGSVDGSPEAVLAQGYADLSIVRLAENRGGAARNVGVLRAHTPYVAFCDDDSWWEPGALLQAVTLLDSHPDIGLLAGRVHVGPDDRLDPACAQMQSSPIGRRAGQPGIPVLGFLACAAIVRRDAFLAAGGFHPELGIGGEEQLLAVDLAAAGWEVQYVERLIVHHHPSPSRNPVRRRIAMSRNALWFCWLRRPAALALRSTARGARKALGDRAERAALTAALAGLPWVLRSRRTLPGAVESHLRALEAQGRKLQ